MTTPLRLLAAAGLAAGVCLSAAPAAGALAPSGGGENSGDQGRNRPITPADTYMPMAPLVTGVRKDLRLRGLIHIEFGLDVETERERQRVERLAPRLRDAWTSVMATYSGTGYRYGDVPDAGRISVILQDAADDVLGPDKARVVLSMIIIHDS